ncbi:MAG: tetratricopeptide repeat protein, partial [Candidatus Zixiibacteriota bacterium]
QKAFKTATEKAPQNVMAFANLGRVHFALRQWLEAETAFNSAIELDSKNAEMYKELGKVLFYGRRDFPKVVETISKCHELGGGDYLTYYMLGKAYQGLEKITDAIAALKKSLEFKSYAKAHSALGRIYLGQEKFVLAAQEFKAAFEANPKEHRAAFNYAVAVQSANPNDYDASIKAWEDYLKVAKGNPRAKNQLAQARQVIKDLKDAKENSESQ